MTQAKRKPTRKPRPPRGPSKQELAARRWTSTGWAVALVSAAWLLYLAALTPAATVLVGLGATVLAEMMARVLR